MDTTVRLHSCEHGFGCPTLKESHTVFITPILSRSATGEAVLEMGAGGGAGDLVQSHELQLDGMQDILDLTKVCAENIVDKEARKNTLGFVLDTILSQKKSLPLAALDMDVNENSIPLVELVRRLSSLVKRNGEATLDDPCVHKTSRQEKTSKSGKDLPTTIVCT